MTEKDEAPPTPEWLNDDFIRTCIKNDIGATEAIHIKNVKLQYVVPKGENFLSLIIRMTVNFKLDSEPNDNTNEKKYIIKITRVMEAMKEYYDDHGIYFREVDTYTNLFPTFQNVLREVGLDTRFSSRCLNVINEHGVLVMEDLGVQKYVLADRVKGTDLESTKIVYRKLARLHGASMRYYEQNGFDDVPAYYFKGLIRRVEDEKMFEALDEFIGPTVIKKAMASLANDLKTRPEYKEEAELMSGLVDYAYDMLCDAFTYNPGNPLNCFLHGDCWINNMLFKYDDAGQPIDVLLVDLQMTCVTPVTNEFLYYFISSTSDDVRQYHYQDIVKFYYDTLIETLDKVGYKGNKPTLEQLHEGILTSSPLLFMHLCMFLPMLKADAKNEELDRSKSDSSGLEEFFAKSERSRRNPDYLKTLFITMDLLKENGILKHYAEMLKNLRNSTS